MPSCSQRSIHQILQGAFVEVPNSSASQDVERYESPQAKIGRQKWHWWLVIHTLMGETTGVLQCSWDWIQGEAFQLSLCKERLRPWHWQNEQDSADWPTSVKEPRMSILRSFSLIPRLCTSCGSSIMTLTATNTILAISRGICSRRKCEHIAIGNKNRRTWKKNAHLRELATWVAIQ